MKRATLLATILVVAVLSPAGALGTAGATATDATNAMEQDCTFPVTKTDATGTEVTVDAEPQRIVTLSPSAAQTAWEIGAKDKVVGVTKYATYLDGAESKANVSGSGMTTVVREKVVAQNPDLVLAPNIIPDQTVRKLREAGLTVYKFGEATSVEDIYAKTTLTGRLTGECAGANETVDWMKDRVSTVEQAVEGQDSPRVLYSMRGGYTAGEGTFINKIIEAAGGTNVAAEAGISGYKSISKEVVVERNPQWIVFDSDRPVPDEYGATAAAKDDQTVVLDRNYVNQPAPRIVLPITKLAKTFHPEAYERANVTTTTTATSTATSTTDRGETSTTTTTTTTTVESSGQPGFGVGVAAVALAAVALLARRE
ncbi:PGF-CTERM-anchored ABC transporter substrate-binding protein [Halomicrococcus gelatinilyticus]|uniref:PGF-CTERM-anchored ABC transporter substrate-binding protein n=1 Tax=Halomicrococcus gelatinilyticus TaxID=1702103 RepID=UPI002E157BFD